MYDIHFVESRHDDWPVHTEKFLGNALDDVLTRARLSFKNIHLTVPPEPWCSDIIGFIIYDGSGREVAREYPIAPQPGVKASYDEHLRQDWPHTSDSPYGAHGNRACPDVRLTFIRRDGATKLVLPGKRP